MADRSRPCAVHGLTYCDVCNPRGQSTYRRGEAAIPVPAGHYVEIRGGKGVYHHPDCYNVTGDWDGSDIATLGERLVRSPEEIRKLELRPAQCCVPPTMP